MKKIRDKAAQKEKHKEKLILGGIIIFLMVSSVMGYFGSKGGGANYRYGDYKFKKATDGYYVTKYNGVLFRFNFLPQALVNMSVNEKGLELLKGKQLLLYL